MPNSSSEIKTFRTTQFRHNSIGLRDEEFSLDAKPTIMFLEDSFVWGLDSQVDERFSDLLKPKIPDHKIVAAGVSGYGTDQEYLLLKRLWPKVKPAVVVLIFCAQNDRLDNMTNRRYEYYHKPYFVTQPDGSVVLAGQPIPKSLSGIFQRALAGAQPLAGTAGDECVCPAQVSGRVCAGPHGKSGGEDSRIRRRQRR